MSFVDEVLQKIGVKPEDPQFYPKVCSYFTPRPAASLEDERQEIQAICFEEFEALSAQLDQTQIQESCSVRNVIKSRRIATKLVADNGELRLDLVPLFIDQMQKAICSIAPDRQYDVVRDVHILDVLKILQSNNECARLLKRMSRPYSNRLAEDVIRQTLRLDEQEGVRDAHVRRAVLSAWLCTLRQSLGSCFATAPAILVQQEQPLFFLRDLDEMMNTGCMKKTFAGVENSVPMSSTWGKGGLKKPILDQVRN